MWSGWCFQIRLLSLESSCKQKSWAWSVWLSRLSTDQRSIWLSRLCKRVKRHLYASKTYGYHYEQKKSSKIDEKIQLIMSYSKGKSIPTNGKSIAYKYRCSESRESAVSFTWSTESSVNRYHILAIKSGTCVFICNKRCIYDADLSASIKWISRGRLCPWNSEITYEKPFVWNGCRSLDSFRSGMPLHKCRIPSTFKWF